MTGILGPFSSKGPITGCEGLLTVGAGVQYKELERKRPIIKE